MSGQVTIEDQARQALESAVARRSFAVVVHVARLVVLATGSPGELAPVSLARAGRLWVDEASRPLRAHGVTTQVDTGLLEALAPLLGLDRSEVEPAVVATTALAAGINGDLDGAQQLLGELDVDDAVSVLGPLLGISAFYVRILGPRPPRPPFPFGPAS